MSSSTSTPSGSSDQSIKIGYVRRAHGIKGAVIVRPLTDDPSRFAVGEVLATDRDEPSSVTISVCQPHKEGLLVSLEGIGDRNRSEELRGLSFFVDPASRRDLEDDEYWPEQLIGLSLVDDAGGVYGEIVEIITGAAQDRLRVETPEGHFEVPFVSAIVTGVDIAGGVVVADLPDGLADPLDS